MSLPQQFTPHGEAFVPLTEDEIEELQPAVIKLLREAGTNYPCHDESEFLNQVDALFVMASASLSLPSPCGHPSQYAYSEDGGAHMVCLLCERDTNHARAEKRLELQSMPPELMALAKDQFGKHYLQFEIWVGHVIDAAFDLGRAAENAVARSESEAITERELAALVRRLAARINLRSNRDADKAMVAQALDYLQRKGLQGTITRDEPRLTNGE